MIYEIEKKDYTKVKNLFSQLADEHMSVVVALEHNYPSRIFVDNLDSPRSGLIYLGKRTLGFGGKSDNENFNDKLNKLLENELLPLLKNELKVREVIIRYDDNWEDKVKSLFNDLVEHQLGNYIFSDLKYDFNKHRLPEGYEYVPIDSDLLKREDLKNFFIVERWVRGCYLSTEDYLSRGFGFCIIHKDVEIASVCFCNYISKDRERCEIGIITAEDHRQKGLAKNLVSYTVSHSLKLNIQRIDWQSRLSNIGSIKIADAVGFRLEKTYTGYVLEYQQ
ncbi:MAG: GNAT family N-acetyltransferase [Candidatus Heimdallarchaeota archaeon]|nr:GNAT family N-acetyltransferase [Candidatus Heimdallarchaeota archaeon]MCK4876995.1 GNAT family N-acetyltransferase [Candidatus Heimdallarchaeota archaeon]